MLSVVVPIYNEEENLPELVRRTTAALELWCEFELVLVNDGSRDRTYELMDSATVKNPHVVAVHLSRNFGHQAAISAGLSVARGDVVAVMDGDLQDPPEALRAFVEKLDEGYDVVYAIREKRKEGLLKRIAYKSFYRLLRKIGELDIPLDAGDFGVMRRRVVDSLLALPEKGRFVRGLRSFVGFRQIGMSYERDARHAGEPKYTLRKLIALAVDGIVGFSSSPLRVLTYLGLFVGAGALVSGGLLFAYAIRKGNLPPGWASIACLLLFLGSLQMLALGVIGEYLKRVLAEVKGRPNFIISDIRRNENDC